MTDPRLRWSMEPTKIKPSEITDQTIYITRRHVLRAAGLVGSVAATGLIYRQFFPAQTRASLSGAYLANVKPADPQVTGNGFYTSEPKTPFDRIASYNNFYEFSLDKELVADVSAYFITSPWSVQVGGLCSKPKTFALEELIKLFPAEERVYRMRCVEGWSMIIPWDGFELGKLLEYVQPLSSAKYVRLFTLFDPKRMPNQSDRVLPWPYEEGLRMDEAMHPLTILATGIYGRTLPPQDGAPIRLVVPWKYGFKGIKSIVKIELTERQPRNTWNKVGPGEYGFYANVAPQVDHPRWSQATELRIGDTWRRPTLPFNGYAEQVAQLYKGMDLSVNF